MYLRSSDGMWRVEPTRTGLAIRHRGFLVAERLTVERAQAYLAEHGVAWADLVED